MKSEYRLSSLFPAHLFWDCDYEKLDLKRDKSLIIPRAFYATDKDSFEEDIEKVEHLYTKTEILEELKSTDELISNEVCDLVAKRYQVAKFSRFER
ncbi:MAG: hypothetical protein IPL46_11110 [Saprospiraceae bacterium]|nr:hypothetical protein [Saprospiraceae bacterium]